MSEKKLGKPVKKDRAAETSGGLPKGSTLLAGTHGLNATGGRGVNATGGRGVNATGGRGVNATGGRGVNAQ